MTNDSRGRQFATGPVVALIAGVVALLVLTGAVMAGPIVTADTVFEASASGPTVTITEQLELEDSFYYPDGETVDLSPHAYFNSSSATAVTVESITGTWTNVTTDDVSSELEINASDKQAVRVKSSNMATLDVGSIDTTSTDADVVYDADAQVTLTVTDQSANSALRIQEVGGSTIDSGTTDGSGEIEFTLSSTSGTRAVTVVDNESPTAGSGSGSDGGGLADPENIVNRDTDTEDDQTEGEDDQTDTGDDQTGDEDEQEGDSQDGEGGNGETGLTITVTDQSDESEDSGDDTADEGDDSGEDTANDGDDESDAGTVSVTIENTQAGQRATLDESTTGRSSLGTTENVSMESVSMDFARGRDRSRLNITTHERDVVTQDGTVAETARQFEETTGSVSAGYLDVDHDFAAGDLDGVTFQYAVRKSYLEEVGVSPADVQLYRTNESIEWQPVETTPVSENTTHQRFESSSPGFSVFAIGTSAEPLALRQTELSASTITVGNETTVTATIANRGGIDRERTVTLTADGTTVRTETLSVPGGESVSTEFAFAPEEAGEYDLAVDGESVGTVTVQESTGRVTEEPTESSEQGDGDDGGFPMLVVGLVIAIVVVAVAVVGYRRRTGGGRR